MCPTNYKKNKKYDVQLIGAPLDEGVHPLPRSSCFPPLALLSLASYLKEQNPSLEIQILDGNILSFEQIVQKINAQFVAISASFLSYKNCLKIAEKAKENGATVILGGPYVSSVREFILQKRLYVDYVVVDDGEHALNEIINQNHPSKIANLCYRENGTIKINTFEHLDINKLPFIQFNLMPELQIYYQNHQRLYPYLGASRALPFYSQKGCKWADLNGGCIFCWNKTPNRIKKPARFWAEIEYYVKNYNADFIWDVSNFYLSDRDWLEEIRKLKPKNLNPRLYIYGRSSSVTEDIMKVLKELNVKLLLIGFESMDEECLKKCNKGITIADNKRVVDLCERYDIYLLPSFILGLPGETIESATKTIEFIRQLLSKYTIVKEIVCSILMPFPGTKCFSELMENQGIEFSDYYNWHQLQKLWIDNYCKISLQELRELQKEIIDYKSSRLNIFGIE